MAIRVKSIAWVFGILAFQALAAPRPHFDAQWAWGVTAAGSEAAHGSYLPATDDEHNGSVFFDINNRLFDVYADVRIEASSEEGLEQWARAFYYQKDFAAGLLTAGRYALPFGTGGQLKALDFIPINEGPTALADDDQASNVVAWEHYTLNGLWAVVYGEESITSRGAELALRDVMDSSP